MPSAGAAWRDLQLSAAHTDMRHAAADYSTVASRSPSRSHRRHGRRRPFASPTARRSSPIDKSSTNRPEPSTRLAQSCSNASPRMDTHLSPLACRVRPSPFPAAPHHHCSECTRGPPRPVFLRWVSSRALPSPNMDDSLHLRRSRGGSMMGMQIATSLSRGQKVRSLPCSICSEA